MTTDSDAAPAGPALLSPAMTTLVYGFLFAAVFGALVIGTAEFVGNRRQRSRRASIRVDLVRLSLALKSYEADYGLYPDRLDLLKTPRRGNAPYYELPPGWEGKVAIFREPHRGPEPFGLIHYGEDGRPGGEGADADVCTCCPSEE